MPAERPSCLGCRITTCITPAAVRAWTCSTRVRSKMCWIASARGRRKPNRAMLWSPGGRIEQYRALQELEKKGLLTIRVNQLLRPHATDAATEVKMLASYNVKPDEGNAWLHLGGVKLGVDGGFEGGWMTELY